uniref:60S ribosomal protein L27 n=1 Tax=Buddenbrockia bryozoides TaxID=3280430 RepID=B5KGP8_9CNID|nr:ribosomal protein rpl27e [Buddenbrockia plumatellae]
MTKFMKPGKLVIILAGRYAGRKAVVVKYFDDGTPDKPYCHAIVVGLDRYPRPVYKGMNKTKILRKSKMKPFVKVINANHFVPTRYQIDLNFSKANISKQTFKDSVSRKNAVSNARQILRERYFSGKNKWFFKKLRF